MISIKVIALLHLCEAVSFISHYSAYTHICIDSLTCTVSGRWFFVAEFAAVGLILFMPDVTFIG